MIYPIGDVFLLYLFFVFSCIAHTLPLRYSYVDYGNIDRIFLNKGGKGKGKKDVKYGSPNPAMDMCLEADICPDLLLAGIGAFTALACLALYQAVTAAAAAAAAAPAPAPVRRKRSSKITDANSIVSNIKVEAAGEMLERGMTKVFSAFSCAF